MADVLERIVERKRCEVSARKRPLPRPANTRRSLRAALTRPGARFIMEVKQRSPSGHVGLHSLDTAVAAYAPVADAISVLTDEVDFGGSLGDLKRARARFAGPILAKDFIVDAFQVEEARAAGADAVLVMLSVLGDSEAAAVMAAARGFGMDALVEVHDEEELGRALALGATLVGINNRNLKTLSTDLAVSRRLARLIPPNVVVVSESGIRCHEDVRALSPLVDGFLVGSALMRASAIAEEARALVHGRVKLCGLTRADDVRIAYAAGATHVGFIFVPGTPRALAIAEAAPMARRARCLGLKSVGVFRDASVDTIVATANAVCLDAVQLHGAEDATFIATLRSRLPRLEVISARGVVDGQVEPPRNGDRTLFDTGRGGSGKAFDWTLLEGDPELSEAFLAGGIGPDNAAAARRVGSFGLDICSSVESAPGMKDESKVRSLFDALRPSSRGEA